jgi:hypothetical protein
LFENVQFRRVKKALVDQQQESIDKALGDHYVATCPKHATPKPLRLNHGRRGLVKKAGKTPLWVYPAGMSRASCSFCVLSSKPDLQIAASLAPELYAAYVAVEQIVNEWNLEDTGRPHTMKQGRTLEEFTGIAADPKLVRRFRGIILRDPEDGIWSLGLPEAVPPPRSTKKPRVLPILPS